MEEVHISAGVRGVPSLGKEDQKIMRSEKVLDVDKDMTFRNRSRSVFENGFR